MNDSVADELSKLRGEVTALRGDIKRLEDELDRKFLRMDAMVQEGATAAGIKFDNMNSRVDILSGRIDKSMREIIRRFGRLSYISLSLRKLMGGKRKPRLERSNGYSQEEGTSQEGTSQEGTS